MNEETFNMSMRKFLKKFGVTSQQQLEKAVRDAVANGRIKDSQDIPVKVVLTSEVLDKPFEVNGTLKLT